jgi:hypothetical protein
MLKILKSKGPYSISNDKNHILGNSKYVQKYIQQVFLKIKTRKIILW